MGVSRGVAGFKIHAAGTWLRDTEDGRPLATSAITYILTKQDNRWGVQARFAAGVTGIEAPAGARNAAAALDAGRTADEYRWPDCSRANSFVVASGSRSQQEALQWLDTRSARASCS